MSGEPEVNIVFSNAQGRAWTHRAKLLSVEAEGPWLTWNELAKAIEMMPPERRDDPVQLMGNGCEEPHPLDAAIGFFSVEEMCQSAEDPAEVACVTRGVLDNEHHPEHFVLLTDGNPFSKDGDSYYTVVDGGLLGNKTGKVIDWCGDAE